MNFSQIKCFLAAAETGSFTKAADRLYLSQPVLSRQIAAMEDELGMELFFREKKSVRLTPAGQLFAEGMSKLADDYRALLEKAAALDRGYEGALSIGMIEGQLLCPPYSELLSAFSQRYPKVKIDLSRHNIAELRDALATGALDIAFGASFNADADQELEYVEVGIAKTYLYIPVNHPLAGREGLSLADFRDDTFLSLPESESPFISTFPRRLLEQLGFAPHVLVAPNIGSLSLWLEAGYGIFAMNANHYLSNSPNLKRVALPELRDTVEVVMWRRDTKNSVVRLFAAECRRHIGEK